MPKIIGKTNLASVLTIVVETTKTLVMPITSTSASIRAEMARRGIRQVDLAEPLGLTQGQVSARLSDHIDWRVPELRIVAQVLGVPVATLIEESTEAPTVPEPRDAAEVAS